MLQYLHRLALVVTTVSLSSKSLKINKGAAMSDWLFKSWVKATICSAVLFFFYHLFISQKLEEEVSTKSKEQE
jgi:hypothetical protein